MRRLEGKAALVTGGGAGIGAAVADAFCREGAAVLLVDRDAAALAATAAALRERLPDARVAVAAADVADDGAPDTAVAAAAAVFGRLDVLVNNAAMRHHAPVSEASPQAWRAVLDVNLLAAAAFSRAALPLLRAGGRGAIVNVSSCYAVTGRAGMAAYDASKAALLALTRTLAVEEAAHGIRANAVCPGSTLTDFQLRRAQAAGQDRDALLQARRHNSLAGRWGTPEEIAWPVLWLASDEASFVTGATLMVDGGLSVL